MPLSGSALLRQVDRQGVLVLPLAVARMRTVLDTVRSDQALRPTSAGRTARCSLAG
jgi:hypothetical protein